MREQRCEQCGRVGTRGFKTIPATEYTTPITVCANGNACRKRWQPPVYGWGGSEATDA
jgi:hypothetical protein